MNAELTLHSDCRTYMHTVGLMSDQNHVNLHNVLGYSEQLKMEKQGGHLQINIFLLHSSNLLAWC